MAKQLSNGHGRTVRRSDAAGPVRDSQAKRLREALNHTDLQSLPETSGVRQVAEKILHGAIARLDRGDAIDKQSLRDTAWDQLDVTGDDWDAGVGLAEKLGQGLI